MGWCCSHPAHLSVADAKVRLPFGDDGGLFEDEEEAENGSGFAECARRGGLSRKEILRTCGVQLWCFGHVHKDVIPSKPSNSLGNSEN